MSGPQSQDTAAAAAAAAASPRYTALRETALAFIKAQSLHHDLASRIDLVGLRRLVSPSYTHAFGPAHAVAQTPRLQGAFSMDAFVEHLQGMLPRLAGWDVDVESVAVDEVRASVVVRVRYGMRVQGAGEVVVNEVVWWLEMEEGSEGWKVGRSTELVDAAAAGRIRELMMQGKGDVAV